MLQPNPDRNTLWRFVGNGRGHAHVFRVVLECSTEIVAVSENSPALGYFSGIVASEFPSWSWMGGRFEFFRDFQFVAGHGYNYDRRKRL
jgi:hypothetical protein